MNRASAIFIGCEADYEGARAVLFGAPFDSTTSFRPGARFGPAAIRGESFGIETYSPYQNRDLEELSVLDIGDLELPFGPPGPALEKIERISGQILDDGKLPVLLGGEHLVTLGGIRAAVKRYPDLRIVHFDAHADLRDEYLGQSLSHATVIRRSWELTGDGRIFQLGIRSGCKEEFAWGREHVHTQRFSCDSAGRVAEELGDSPVYLTLDLDVLDPSLLPGTGTPEAGGLSFARLLEGLLAFRGSRIVAFDMTELSPHYDQSGASTAAACKLLREMLLAFCQQ